MFLSGKIIVVIIYRGKDGSDMKEKDEREAEAELGMLGFMMPDFHAEKSTDAAAQESNTYQFGLRDAPFVMAGFPFIDAVHKERHDIYRREINQDSV